MKTHLFHTQLSPGSIDQEAGIIRGVSVLTADIEARGHDLRVDRQCLEEMLHAARAKGRVPVKLNHRSGIESVVGFLENFRVQGGSKLLADWHLLKSHPETETILERAEVMPDCFGLSAAFVGQDEIIDGTKCARCSELLSVDCVPNPAANPTGLFSADPRPRDAQGQFAGAAATAGDPNAGSAA